MEGRDGRLSSKELAQEVKDVLSMRRGGSSGGPDAATPRTSAQQISPGTPSKAPPHTELLIQSSLDGSKSKDTLPTPAAAASRGAGRGALPAAELALDDGSMDSMGTGTSSMVGRAWVADAAQDGKAASRTSKLRKGIKSFRQVVRAHPYILVVSALVTAIIAAAGVAGVLAAAHAETAHRKDSATGFANNAAVAFEVQLQQTFAPLSALSAIIHFQPDYRVLAPRFDPLAQELLEQLPVQDAVESLQMTPQGVVRSFYPLKGNEKAMGHNLFKDPQRRPAAIETVQSGQLTMQGPVKLLQGFYGAIARVPIFISNVSSPNETFGAPDRVWDCPPGLCFNATARTMFWGFVSCIVNLQNLATGKDTRLRQLEELGYDYVFTAPQPAGEPMVIAATPAALVDPVTAVVEVPNNKWSLAIAPRQGWVPTWRDPMIATVVVASLVIGLLVLATLVSRHLQLWLLKEMRSSNRKLADEKHRMDVLLARQYNLISCMAQQGIAGSDGSRGMSSLEAKTLEQIVSMKRAIGNSSFSASGDQLQMLELLGEGTFGKVYKGVWRGSTVAIKTMVLPAKMSGAEKRERMAIMEAAISSTMNHPNIVQTYTYTIKPATASGAAASTAAATDTAASASAGASMDSAAGSQAFEGETASNVHSFEVSLVLEYCDWGCLRDALDSGAFVHDNTVNYAAVLDTAADMARAMLHLHCNQVIHSDLKVRNVLLKSDGSSERGCTAKVADFGLAVKIETHDTHVSAFQGTMSHMAPEALLRGHISKAGDVYSFGITLWELFTGGHAYHGIPKALLGHQVAVVGLRPCFPDFTPSELKVLAELCWHPEPDKRPSFDDILSQLQRMRAKLGGPTPPLGKVVPRAAGSRATTADNSPGTQQPFGTRSTSAEQQARVKVARDTGLVQLASYYVDNSSIGSAGGHPLGSSAGSVHDVGGSSALLQPHTPGAPATYTRAGRDRSTAKLPPISDAVDDDVQDGGDDAAEDAGAAGRPRQ